MSNEDQPTQWGMKGEKMLKPKSKGSGIMVSDFVDEHNGFLALMKNMTQRKRNIPTFESMPAHSWNMVRIKRGIGLATNSSRRWNVQLSSLR